MVGFTQFSASSLCPTFFQDGVPLCPVNLLPSNDVAGGVGKVNELALSMKVQSSGVHQILYGDHVLIWHLGIHVHAPDDPWATFTIDQEELVFGFCSKTKKTETKERNLDVYLYVKFDLN